MLVFLTVREDEHLFLWVRAICISSLVHSSIFHSGFHCFVCHFIKNFLEFFRYDESQSFVIGTINTVFLWFCLYDYFYAQGFFVVYFFFSQLYHYLTMWVFNCELYYNGLSECVCVCASVSVCSQSYLTLCNPMDYSLPSPSVHGIFQARILEYSASSFFRGSSRPRDRTHFSCTSCIGRWVLYQLNQPGKPFFLYKAIMSCPCASFSICAFTF